jgi:hypothetical protein
MRDMVILKCGAPECVPRLAKKVNRATHHHESTTRGNANQTYSEGIEGSGGKTSCCTSPLPPLHIIETEGDLWKWSRWDVGLRQLLTEASAVAMSASRGGYTALHRPGSTAGTRRVCRCSRMRPCVSESTDAR